MEAGEYRLTRGTCFIARRLEVIAVAELQWISWCVQGAEGFRAFLFSFFFFERTRPAASMRPPCLIDVSTSTVVEHGGIFDTTTYHTTSARTAWHGVLAG